MSEGLCEADGGHGGDGPVRPWEADEDHELTRPSPCAWPAGAVAGLEAGGGAAVGSRRPWTRYAEALASVICERVARGESVMEICREPDMPSRDTVRVWRRSRPEFAARMAEALRAGRHRPQGGRRAVWHPQVGALICERVASGMSLRQACDLPGLPCETTVYAWLDRMREFREAYLRARHWQAHRRFDQVWEIAEGATPGTAYAARVKIEAARWQAERMVPRRFGARSEGIDDREALTPDGQPRVRLVSVRHFFPEPGEPEWFDYEVTE